MKIESDTERLQLSSSLSPQDLAEAQSQLGQFGEPGTEALAIMKRVGEMIAKIDSLSAEFKLILCYSDDGKLSGSFSLNASTSNFHLKDQVREQVLDYEGLSNRARVVAIKRGLLTLGQLEGHSAAELRRVKNCGDSTIEEFRNILANVGLKLKDE